MRSTSLMSETVVAPKATRFKPTDLLTEIMTRKDGGSKGGAMHKAHMSHYNHLRRMKRKANSIALGYDTTFQAELASNINSDLDCVFKEPKINPK